MSSDEKPTFHLTTESLLTELLTLEQSSKTTSPSLLAYQKAVANLAADIASGKVSYEEAAKISDTKSIFRSANAKFSVSKKTPEQRSAAGKKGAQTYKSRQEWEQEKLSGSRSVPVNAGYLPKELDSYEGEPNKVYYRFSHSDPKSGIDHFVLKQKYLNVPLIQGMSKSEIKDFLYPSRVSGSDSY